MAASMKAFRGTAASGARRAAVVPRAEKEVCRSLRGVDAASACCLRRWLAGYRSLAGTALLTAPGSYTESRTP